MNIFDLFEADDEGAGAMFDNAMNTHRLSFSWKRHWSVSKLELNFSKNCRHAGNKLIIKR